MLVSKLGMAKFKGASSQKSINLWSRDAGRQLTKEDTLGQKGECLNVAENKSGIRNSEYTGEV